MAGLKPEGRRNTENRRISLPLVLAACVAALMLYFAFRAFRAPGPEPDIQSGPLVRAELLADTDSVVPGREFFLGIRFKITPQWHIYHKDPGDAGLPTTVEFDLPEGFSSSALLYPAPMRFTQPGDIVGYGYKDEVMLLANVVAPAELPLDKPVSLQAHARWLACREKCILEDQQLELVLPVSAGSRPALQDLFQDWLRRVPPES